MSLHPDDRPQDIETFRQALMGDLNPINRPPRSMASPMLSDMIFSRTEWILVGVAVGVLILSFIATLMP